MQTKLAILLSTYNGAAFLAEQLDSLLAQSYKNFIVVMRDDGSSDDTLEILQDYQQRHPQYFTLLENDGINLGACAGFSFLMQYTLDNKTSLGLASAYMMFCDQDDTWHVDKVKIEMGRMLETEAELISQKGGLQDTVQGKTAVLVHSDLAVVDENGALIAASFMTYQGLSSNKKSLSQLLLSNTVTGCTALANEALIEQALPLSENAIMHDWWLAINAAAFGSIVFENSALVNYRQHGKNTLGAKPHIKTSLVSRVLKIHVINSHIPLFAEVSRQALAFLQVYANKLSRFERLILKLAIGLNSRHGIVQRGLFRLLRLL
ncbi:MAG: hypothetical protein COC19_03145 [SAR86 cluster bacterium]|uniref:Glycosyltransferase 2-like domain-containing protein n=1 Tax=SAR86 cluster bacterium TaxID=2030880 RepID=A0A2A4MQS4_9GAMM|nr:MAG: hypothetical protein COC19_03145 [SAR86 cluster bacterium]